MKDHSHLIDNWRDMDDHRLRDCIEVNEKLLERARNSSRPYRRQMIQRHEANLKLLTVEEDRRVRDAMKS